MLVYFWIDRGPPLFVQGVEVTRPEVSWQEAQTLFMEGSSQGTPTAEDDPQG